MFTKFHYAILRAVYNKGCIEPKYCTKTSLLDGLSSYEAIKAYQELVRWNYLKSQAGCKEEMVSLNPQQIQEIRQLLNPRTPDAVKDKPPVEYFYDSTYEKGPFYKANGDKKVRGKYAIYSYHKNLSDETKLIAYIVVDGEKKGTIRLGSFFDKNSLLSKAVRRIDEKYGAQQFSKADLGSLGKDIEGNRQPPKAIIDMLLYHGYIVRKGNKYYERTEKQLPKTELFEFQSQPSTSIELTSEKESWSKSGFRLVVIHFEDMALSQLSGYHNLGPTNIPEITLSIGILYYAITKLCCVYHKERCFLLSQQLLFLDQSP